jgi:hypothetical protein
MPSRIFSDTDILSLIQTFEASNPWPSNSKSESENEHPPLTLNTSRTHLIHTTHLHSHLLQILHSPSQKHALSKSHLADLLDITPSNLEKLLTITPQQQRITITTKNEILPESVLERIKSTLRDLLSTKIVDLRAYAEKNYLEILPFMNLLDEEETKRWRHLVSPHPNEYLWCFPSVLENLHEILARYFSEAVTDAKKLVVSQIPELEEYDHEVIMAIFKARGGDNPDDGGTCKVEEEGRVVFVPRNFELAEEKRRRRELEDRVEDLVDRVAKNSYCEIEDGDDDLREAVMGRLGEIGMLLFASSADAKAARGSSLRQKCYIVARMNVESSLASLKAAIEEEAQTRWAKGERKLEYSEILRELYKNQGRHQSQLEKIIIDSGSFTSELEAHLRSKIATLDAADQETYLKLLIERLLIPGHLYILGLEIVQDEALRARLSTYACSHLLSDISSLADELKAQHLLTGAREKDFTRFRSTATELKDLSALQSAATKLAKKSKWDAQPFSTVQTRQIKTTILQRTAHAMRPSPTIRPSDVLQHALWILLGVASEGVFISAGKDTSRMIALYENVSHADAAMVEKLKGLRDKLKKGETADEEVREMRELVKGSIDAFVREA